jgi:hypothetical protein
LIYNIKKDFKLRLKFLLWGGNMKNTKKMVASLLCAAALVSGFSVSASAATSDTNTTTDSGKYTTYTAGRW